LHLFLAQPRKVNFSFFACFFFLLSHATSREAQHVSRSFAEAKDNATIMTRGRVTQQKKVKSTSRSLSGQVFMVFLPLPTKDSLFPAFFFCQNATPQEAQQVSRFPPLRKGGRNNATETMKKPKREKREKMEGAKNESALLILDNTASERRRATCFDAIQSPPFPPPLSMSAFGGIPPKLVFSLPTSTLHFQVRAATPRGTQQSCNRGFAVKQNYAMRNEKKKQKVAWGKTKEW